MRLTVNRHVRVCRSCRSSSSEEPLAERPFAFRLSLHSCARINTQSLDVHSSLAKQHRGGRHEDRDALEKAISCSNRNMMGYSIYPIKISFTEILLNKYTLLKLS